jgi:molybdopterin converting factor small subunit
MDQRSNLIWTFLIILAVAIVIWEVYNTYIIASRVGFYRREAAQTILGTDEQLSQTVNQLETTLAERQAYQVNLEKDPLNLGEVIRSQKLLNRLGFQEMEEDNEMRLSCTIVGEAGNSAVLKLGGRSQVVEIGDVVNGYKITEISEKEMTLKRGGEVLVLKNQKAALPWQQEAIEAMPAIESMPPISGGNGGNF